MNISVIIPVYNAEKYIEKAIKSCLQLPEVKEIVVVDDGYKDNSKEIVRELSERHPIIKIYEHPNNENRGAGSSRNLGIEKATQKYIAFLDADDFYLPNRFVKDKEVFRDNPDADGCYNAIGCHFYSEAAKESFLSCFPSAITTVNPMVRPTPQNLFRGRIGLIPNYGYFSLDGLTIKKRCLFKNAIAFPSLNVHQDTAFMIKLAYHTKLYPSEIIQPVALRGVHEENRITANYQSAEIKKYKNQFLLWSYLYDWAKEENIDEKEFNYLKKIYTFYKLHSNRNPKPKELRKVIAKNPRLLFNNNYPKLHSMYFGHSFFSLTFLKARNLLNRLVSRIYRKL